MTLDLAQFHDTFFAESFEALDSMEAALLKLSAGDVDLELINTIFRVAHSIKGGSATFGFTDVAGFTHTLETLLDQMRAGKRRVDSGLVDMLLRSCDLMREMLGATQDKQADGQGARRRAARRDRTHHGHAGRGTDRYGCGCGCAGAGSARLSPAETRSGWRIHFVPGPKLLRNGNDPLRLLRELTTLAPCEVRVDAKWVPPLAELDPEECRLSWRIEMTGAVAEAAIKRGVRLGRRRVRTEHRGLWPRCRRHRDDAGAQTTRRRGIRDAGARGSSRCRGRAIAAAAPPPPAAVEEQRRQTGASRRTGAPAARVVRSASASRRSTSC